MSPVKDSAAIVLQEVRVFFPGEQVQGNLYLRLTGESKIKNIQISFFGESRVEFYQNKTYYELKLPHFAEQALLYDRDTDAQTQGKFSAGEYTFPFIFTIPDCVPSSYQQTKGKPAGHTLYGLTATVQRSSKSKLKSELMINIFEKVDVSLPEFQIPRSEQHDEHVTCCCVGGGTIKINAKLNKSGYYPGEVIQAKLFVENMSNRDVTYVELVLKNRIIYQYGKKDYDIAARKYRIAAMKSIGVPRGQSEDIECLTLEIPHSLQPSTGEESETIITILYYMDIIGHVKGSCVSAAKLRIPITIGSYIPLESLACYPGSQAQPNTDTRM